MGRAASKASAEPESRKATMADGFKYHQYQVVGRHLPTESDPSPSLYRMKVWAVDEDLAARHRIRASCIQIIKTGVLADEDCKRPNITQFHKENLAFPLPIKTKRPSEKKYRSTFKANRPNVAHF